MTKIINWLKNNKLITVLMALVCYLLLRSSGPSLLTSKSRLLNTASYGEMMVDAPSSGAGFSLSESLSGQNLALPKTAEVPAADSGRMVVQETNLSLLVNDVDQTAGEILSYVENNGGFLVSQSLTKPEEAPYGTLIVRIPASSLHETLDQFKGLAVKVTSEYISGRDVTDQYEDIGKKLETLEKTKAKFDAIMDQAVKIDDILRVQREIINLQSQIDNLKGRQLLLEQTVDLAKITIYLSTDELALPYAPDGAFRPQLIFKLATRSLIKDLRKLATTVIWLAVYTVIWVPLFAIVLFVRKIVKNRKRIN